MFLRASPYMTIIGMLSHLIGTINEPVLPGLLGHLGTILSKKVACIYESTFRFYRTLYITFNSAKDFLGISSHFVYNE